MAHFEKAGANKSSSVVFSTHVDDRKQIWRATVPHGAKFDVVLWGGDSLKVESPGGLLKFSEGKSPGKDRRKFTITADSFGSLELHAKHKNGSVWDKLEVNVTSKIEQGLRQQVINVLKHKSIQKMDFQAASLRISPARMRKMGTLLRKGEIIVRYDPSLPLGAYIRKRDELLVPYAKIATDEQKANACHELSHALMDRYYPGKELQRAATEAVGYIVQLIYLRVAKPGLTESKVKQVPLVIEAFRAAGEVIANKKVSATQFGKLRSAVAASGVYRDQKSKITYDGI